MFQDYVDRINEKYHEMRTSGQLSPRLAQPTLARLREECMDVYIARFDRKDENTLRVFFRHTGDTNTLARTIERFDLGKFKPLRNFLTGRTNSTDQKNIELLAWLIDFKRRPFELGENYNLDGEDNVSKQTMNDGKTVESGIKKDTDKPGSTGEQASQTGKSAKKKRGVIIAIAILLLAAVGYKWGFNSSSGNSITGQGECMYWTGDHYEFISCQQRKDTLVVALDTLRLRNFRRITNTDTITHHSVGKLWYRKKNGKLEIYSSGGYDPVDIQVELRPLSEHMFRKYLNKPTP